MVEIPTLETERLRLRAWRADDLDSFARWYADPQVMRYLGDGTTADRAQTWAAVARAIGHWVLRGYGQWVVERKDTGEPVGRSGLFNPEGWPGLEVGWTLGREHWGNGFATEAGARALRYAFENVGATRVISLIQPGNASSIRVAEKLGGVLDDRIELGGKDVLVYAYDAPDASRRQRRDR